ncbi:hypothetical protein Bca52824_032371 [Brassica carinata]|uniref:Uncharacterized protein n=1 Tax=Brassica carinata TaxID=52824 RepID=A0A8X7V534_BRACI|nr:hypothetical protein Bca52824_032371 [Brassica carinata]
MENCGGDKASRGGGAADPGQAWRLSHIWFGRRRRRASSGDTHHITAVTQNDDVKQVGAQCVERTMTARSRGVEEVV